MRTGEPHPDRNASRFSAFRRFLGFVGPGFLVSVGYMDPGNWATDLAGGSQYGYALLWVILLSNLMAILFQHLCVRLNVATGLDLAQACRERYSPLVGKFLWVAAQLGIVAMDLAELLGSAIALQILFGIRCSSGPSSPRWTCSSCSRSRASATAGSNHSSPCWS